VLDLLEGEAVIDCSSSATAARILLQVCAVAFPQVRIEVSAQLTKRPLETLIDNPPQSGRYEVSGSQSSQYISGLLFALPLLEGDSEIVLTSPLQSSGYVDITIDVLERFGIQIRRAADKGWIVEGGQMYRFPDSLPFEGDWSSAPVWLAAGAGVSGLNGDTLQPDGRAFAPFCENEGDVFALKCGFALSDVIDVSQCPDLTPVLAVMATASGKSVTITGSSWLAYWRAASAPSRLSSTTSERSRNRIRAFSRISYR
jgi:3-phosphoshikimate 1-carboxyvinyltransferase